MTPLREGYRRLLAGWLRRDPSEVFLFWKGRVAFYAILKSAGIGAGDEVILPAFTCLVVANAIRYLGAKPVYADIEPRTLSLTRRTVEPLLTERTAAVIMQNTFGKSPDAVPLRELADKRGVFLFEDCAHGFGGTAAGRPNGAIADAAFFSTQWNKSFSTGLGGIAVSSDHRIRENLSAIERDAVRPSAEESALLGMLLAARRLTDSALLFWPTRAVYRMLSAVGIVPGSSTSDELEGEMPGGYLKALSDVQARAGIRALKGLDRLLAVRRSAVSRYADACRSAGLIPLFEGDDHDNMFLFFPVFCRDKRAVLSAARSAGVELSDWFVSPLHPAMTGWERWGYQRGTCPISERLARSVVGFPTRLGLTGLDRAIGFLSTEKDRFFHSVEDCLAN
jgi:dTDP-4-amino-4,6-dideoxygalactose transaminase